MLPADATRHADPTTLSRVTDSHRQSPAVTGSSVSWLDEDMPDPTQLEELAEATRRLVRTVDGMTESEYAEPSLLPDWSRGHVVAHLALNAEGLAAALRGLVEGRSVPMYASQEARDDDIADLGTAEPETVRGRLLGGVSDLNDAVGAVPEEAWDVSIARTPDGQRTFPAAAVPWMRHREVEIHHADLGLGYSRADWPAPFCERLVESMTQRADEMSLTLHATDLDRRYQVGEGGPTVSGAAADLAWWLTGRGDGAGLTCDRGTVPAMAAW
jgi:maleylpyruvate isomerase